MIDIEIHHLDTHPRAILRGLRHALGKRRSINLSADGAGLDFGLMLGYFQFDFGQVKHLALFHLARFHPRQIRVTALAFQDRMDFDMLRFLHWFEPLPNVAFVTTA